MRFAACHPLKKLRGGQVRGWGCSTGRNRCKEDAERSRQRKPRAVRVDEMFRGSAMARSLFGLNPSTELPPKGNRVKGLK